MKTLALVLLVLLAGCTGLMDPPTDLVLVQSTMAHTVWGVFIEGYIDNIGDKDMDVKVIADLYNGNEFVYTGFRNVFIYAGEHKYFNVALFYEKEFTRYKVRLEY